MEQIKCPHCGEFFTIDESGYTAIVSQIRDKEFDKQIKQNRKELEEKQQTAIDNAVLKAKADAEKMISDLESKIQVLVEIIAILLSSAASLIFRFKKSPWLGIHQSTFSSSQSLSKESIYSTGFRIRGIQ